MRKYVALVFISLHNPYMTPPIMRILPKHQRFTAFVQNIYRKMKIIFFVNVVPAHLFSTNN